MQFSYDFSLFSLSGLVSHDMIKFGQVTAISENDCHQIILRRWHLESLELAHLLVDTILDKKGSHITLLDLREQTVFADYFLICTAENDRQLRALVQSVVDDARQNGKVTANGREGLPEAGWVLVDFGDLIVHLFSPSTRAYYNLEELWAEAHVVLHMQ